MAVLNPAILKEKISKKKFKYCLRRNIDQNLALTRKIGTQTTELVNQDHTQHQLIWLCTTEKSRKCIYTFLKVYVVHMMRITH